MDRRLAVFALLLPPLALAQTGRPATDAPAPCRTMAVTVDDLPPSHPTDLAAMRRVNEGVLAALHRHRVSAVGFVNEIAPFADDIAFALNYGFGRVRFVRPVPVGSRVRARMRLADLPEGPRPLARRDRRAGRARGRRRA